MILGWYFPESMGGTEVYVKNLSKNLIDLNFEIEIAYPSKKGHETYFHQEIKIHTYPSYSGSSIEVLSGKKQNPNLDDFLYLIEDIKPEIVHIHSVITDFGLYHIKKLYSLGIPMVLTVHVPGLICPRGTFMQWGNIVCDRKLALDKCAACILNQRGIPQSLSRLFVRLQKVNNTHFSGTRKIGTLLNTKNYINKWIENTKEIFSLVNQVIVVSDWLMDTIYINGIETEKITINKHGVDLLENKITNTRQGNGFLSFAYIGRITFVKGLHILIKAFKKLDMGNARLEIYGKTSTEEDKKYLNTLLSISRKDKRIRFNGYIDENERDEVLRNSDALVIPSIWYETGPLILLEAFNADLPVIGSGIGGIAEKIEDKKTGLLFNVSDIDDLSSKLKEVIHNPEILRNLSKNIVVSRSNKDVAKDMGNIYMSLKK